MWHSRLWFEAGIKAMLLVSLGQSLVVLCVWICLHHEQESELGWFWYVRGIGSGNMTRKDVQWKGWGGRGLRGIKTRLPTNYSVQEKVRKTGWLEAEVQDRDRTRRIFSASCGRQATRCKFLTCVRPRIFGCSSRRWRSREWQTRWRTGPFWKSCHCHLSGWCRSPVCHPDRTYLQYTHILEVTFMSQLIRSWNILVNDLLDSDRYIYVAVDPYLEYFSHWWTVTFMSQFIHTLNILVNDLLDSDRYFYAAIYSYLEYVSNWFNWFGPLLLCRTWSVPWIS